MCRYLALLLLFAFANPLHAGGDESEFLRRGAAYLAAGDFEKAAGSFEHAVRRNPSSIEALTGLGKSYLKLGDNESMSNDEVLEKAVRAYTAALRLKPDMAGVHYELGTVYLALRNRDGAIRQEEILRQLDPLLAAGLSAAITAWRPPPAYREVGAGDEPESRGTGVVIDRNAVLVPVTLYLGPRTAQVLLALDTGASITTINASVARQLGASLLHSPTAKIQVVGGAMIPARALRLDRLTAGPNSKTGMIVAVIDHTGPAVKFDGLLGMDFLRNLRYHVDFKNQVINWGP
jgi:tetratricopeptide (TPR) repeat protein